MTPKMMEIIEKFSKKTTKKLRLNTFFKQKKSSSIPGN